MDLSTSLVLDCRPGQGFFTTLQDEIKGEPSVYIFIIEGSIELKDLTLKRRDGVEYMIPMKSNSRRPKNTGITD